MANKWYAQRVVRTGERPVARRVRTYVLLAFVLGAGFATSVYWAFTGIEDQRVDNQRARSTAFWEANAAQPEPETAFEGEVTLVSPAQILEQERQQALDEDARLRAAAREAREQHYPADTAERLDF